MTSSELALIAFPARLQLRQELDEGRRIALLKGLHRLLRDEAPAIFVVNAAQKYAFRKRVRGLATSALGLYGIWPGPLAWWAVPEAGQ